MLLPFDDFGDETFLRLDGLSSEPFRIRWIGSVAFVRGDTERVRETINVGPFSIVFIAFLSPGLHCILQNKLIQTYV